MAAFDPVVDPVIGWVVRLALALLFVAAARHKLRDLRGFSATLANYRLLPTGWTPPAAAMLAFCELVVAAALLLPAPRPDAWLAAPVAPLAALGLLALYSGALAVNLARGRRDLDCGCFGPAHRRTISPGLLLRNGVLALGPLLLLLGTSARSLGWVDALSVAGATATLALLWSAAHQLAAVSPGHVHQGGSQ